jgi:uncharacterized protein
VRTDIAGFVGIAERGPLPEDFPPDTFDGSQAVVQINSWSQFLITFGNFQEYGYLAYAVRAFFENGGKECHVARVAATTASDPTQWPARAFFPLPSAASVAIGSVNQVVTPFQCTFTLNGNHAPAARDLLLISGGGVAQLVAVAGILPNGQALMASQLSPLIATGATVSWFPAACMIWAASRGNWGNDLLIQITPIDSSTFSLQATVDLGPNTLPTEDEYYRTLSFDPTSYTYAPTVLAQQSNLIRMDISGSGWIDLGAAAPLNSGVFYLQGGRDGLSAITLRDFSGGPGDLRGLQLMESVPQVAILAIPDAVFQLPPPGLMPPAAPADPCFPPPTSSTPAPPPPVDPTAAITPLTTQQAVQLQTMMIDQCQRLQYRVAVLDPPNGLQISQAQVWPANNGLVSSPSSRFAAFYYPWLMAPDSLEIDGLTRAIPPSGYVVGGYAQTDLTYGVQRPPANIELEWVVDVVQSISDLQQEGLNLNNVDAIRTFPGRGIRVWGARSLAAAGDEAWRFIHVRRLMSAIEKTVQLSSAWVVFQNNTDTIRRSLTHSLTVLLTGIWAKGGLQGAQPANAFYVTCNSTNNPEAVIDQGQLVCEIGIAIAAPMEFLVFEIRQDASGSQIVEN